MAKLAGAKPVILDCPAEDNFLLTPDALQASLSPASRLLILCSPSNPTGSVYSRSAMPTELNLWHAVDVTHETCDMLVHVMHQ